MQQGVQRPTIAEGKKAYLGLECKKKAERGGGSEKVQRVCTRPLI